MKHPPLTIAIDHTQHCVCLRFSDAECAPLYLTVDRFTNPLSITLHSEPGDEGYATITAVGVGQKLHIPAPFDITLDTSALPLPR